MNCVRCGRPLTHPAKTIPAKNGPLMWGPVCAIKSGLIEPKARTPALVTHQQADEVDPDQLTLELTA